MSYRGDLSGTKILVVDDVLPVRSLIRNHLLKIGFLRENVLLASDGSEALGIIEDNLDISHIITDWSMPIMDGVSMIREIRSGDKLPDSVSIFVISGQDEQASVDEALAAGADGYLRKPISLNMIKFMLEESGILDIKR